MIKFDEITDISKKIEILHLRDALKTSRQIAYNVSKADQSFDGWFNKAEELYVQYCAELGIPAEPIFDLDAHRAKRIAEGHRDYLDEE